MSSVAQHGTVSGYVNLPCRKQCCRDAMAAYRRARRAELKAQPVPPEVPHGLASTQQNYGCTCRACRNAANTYNRSIYDPAKRAAYLRARKQAAS